MKSIQRTFLTPVMITVMMTCYDNSSITSKVHRRVTKLAADWSSSIPKRYKENAMHGDCCRAERVSSNFSNEKILIRQMCDNTGYPSPFINSAIRAYEHKQNRRQQQEDFFETAKESTLLEFSYCLQNEVVAKRFLSQFHQFTNQKFEVTIKWIIKKIKSLFSLKD